MRRPLFAILCIVVACICALAVWIVSPSRRPNIEHDEPTALGEQAPYEGQAITGVGLVVPAKQRKLAFAAGGRLCKVHVTPGAVVETGTILAELDAGSLPDEIALAEDAIRAQEQKLQALEAGSWSGLQEAEAQVQAAQVKRSELQVPPAERLAITAAELTRARVAVELAQAAYDAATRFPGPHIERSRIALELAQIELERAQAVHDALLAGPGEEAYKSAQSEVARALARLEALRYQQGTAILEARINLAATRLDLARATLALEACLIRAPFSGTITSTIDWTAGQMVAANAEILTIADLAELEIQCDNLSEWGAANVEPGQTVDLTIPALNGRMSRGKVISVSLEPIATAGKGARYRAIIAPESQQGLRWGSSVNILFEKPGR